MGNHEFCEDCGESDFHLNRPCDPIKVAARKEKEETVKQIAVQRMKAVLDAAKIPYRVDDNSNVLVFGFVAVLIVSLEASKTEF